MSGPIIQNFLVPANDDATLDFTLLPSSGIALSPGTQIYFNAYLSQFGAPVVGGVPLITKTMDTGIIITNPDLKTFSVPILHADTLGLLRNYYYEVTVVDNGGNRVTTTVGVMTVGYTQNRE